MFQHWSTTETVDSSTIHASQSDSWTIQGMNNRHWQDAKVSPPSLCTTIDGSWSNSRSYSPSLASTLYPTNDMYFRTADTEMVYDEQITSLASPINKGDTPRMRPAGFENIHAKLQSRDRTGADLLDDDDDDMTLFGDDEDTTSLEFSKQTPVVGDRHSLLTNMLLQCPPASCASNDTRSSAHPRIILADDNVLSSSLKQQVLWENRVNGVIKKPKNNSHHTLDGLDTFTGFW